nr:hypothetical protein CFP56_22915 [Quercus suber]
MRCWLFLIIYSTNLSLKYLSSVLKGKINLEVVLSSSESSEKLLIGKILSNKSFPGNLVKEILVKAWNVINDIEVTVVDKNIFMFSFLYEADVRRAWDKRPWTVKGEHLILKRFCSDISVSEVDFSTTEFWIQIHGLPLNRRSKENVLKIGSIAGKALDTDLIGPGSRIWSKSVRVRVELDIRCPLVPGFPLEMDNLPVLWIPFKFEKLGNFCFGCGLLGHDLLNCQELGVQNCGFFGKWLRVDNGEFQPGIKLDDFLIPNCQAMVSTLPTSRPSVQINQSSRIQSAKDSRDEMITGEAHGKREEPMEVLEQSKMVTLLQNDGTSLEKVTDVRLNSLASPNLCSNLVTSQPHCWGPDCYPLDSPIHKYAGPSYTRPTITKISSSQPPNKISPHPHPLLGNKRKARHLSPSESPNTSPKKSKHNVTHTSPKLTHTPSHPLPKHSSPHRRKSLKVLARAKAISRTQKLKNGKDDSFISLCSFSTSSSNVSAMAEEVGLTMPPSLP